MTLRALAIVPLLLLPLAAVADAQPDEAVVRAIAAAVTDRLDTATGLHVEILSGAPLAPLAAEELKVVPAVGARLGHPVRFVVTPATGRTFTVLARVTATVRHLVAVRPLARDVAFTRDDLASREAPLDDVPIETLPGLEDVLGARARRAIAAGEVISRTVLVRDYAVRAGDAVTMTLRSGPIEVRGVGRAVSSGFVGDVIRILAPGTRQTSRARVTAAAAVEIIQ